MALAIRYQLTERPQIQQPVTLPGFVELVQLPGNYELKTFGAHLVCLGSADARLQGKQVLLRNPVRFGEYLSPAVLAG